MPDHLTVSLGLEIGELAGQPEWGDIFSQQTQRLAGGQGAGRPTQGPGPPGLEPRAPPTVWGLTCPSPVPLGDEQCPLNQPLLPHFCPPPSLRVLRPHDCLGPQCPRVPASHSQPHSSARLLPAQSPRWPLPGLAGTAGQAPRARPLQSGCGHLVGGKALGSPCSQED